MYILSYLLLFLFRLDNLRRWEIIPCILKNKKYGLILLANSIWVCFNARHFDTQLLTLWNRHGTQRILNWNLWVMGNHTKKIFSFLFFFLNHMWLTILYMHILCLGDHRPNYMQFTVTGYSKSATESVSSVCASPVMFWQCVQDALQWISETT